MGDHQADLVHMGRKHQLSPAAAFYGDQVAQRVAADFIHIRPHHRGDCLGGFVFAPRGAVYLQQRF
jgi:hypothetical protein